MTDISNKQFMFSLFVVFGILSYVLVNVNWDKVDAEELGQSFNPITYEQTDVEFDENKQVICWQGKPYHSYWNQEINLYMVDQSRELNGVQQLIVNSTGLCKNEGSQSNTNVKRES